MNQTKKRLSIINLAISITDIETIQLQILKLSLLKTDEKIQEILSVLQDESYAQAQALIATYIETPNNEILQRTFQKEKEKQEAKDKAIIEEFGLFVVEQEEEPAETTTFDLDDMMEISEALKVNEPKREHQAVNFDSLLNIQTDDIMPGNIDIDISDNSKNDFWDTAKEEPSEDPIEKDTFFDIPINTLTESIHEDLTEIKIENKTETIDAFEIIEELKEEEPFEIPNIEEQFTVVDEVQEGSEEVDEIIEEPKIVKEMDTVEDEIEIVEAPEETILDTASEALNYKAIPYIDQKFKNMQVQYPSTEALNERFTSADQWLLQISNEGYTERDVEAVMQKIDTLREENPSEAAQLLLISAATESKYAQFRLARTLYKGDILQKNLPEAFTLINRLAVNDNYPEAICDLAQFYEYGIGIDKDKEKAVMLYEEAMDLGIKRASEHFERLNKQTSGFFSFLTK